tara:strand:- start:1494 stop:1691 length:198 start_codon:yes stop_codon:yes gene_type:complete
MKNLIKLSRYNNGTLLYLFKYFMIGILHQSDDPCVKGIVIGIWRYQLQLSIGYSEEIEPGDIGHA